MELSPDKFHGRDSFLSRPRHPVPQRRARAPFFIDGCQTDHALQFELHQFLIGRDYSREC